GTLDRSFGRGGLVTERMRSLTTDIIHGIVVQPDGKIVVAGVTFEDVVTMRPHGDFIVARYLSSGEPDLAFGIGGVMTTDFGDGSYDEPYAIVLQPDGKLVLGGYTNSGGGPGVLFGADQLALARYTANGLLDPSYGHGGKVIFDGGSLDERILALALARDGTLLAGGYVNGEKRGDLLLARLEPDGTLTGGFGTTSEGFSIHNLGTYSERISSIVVQPDGMIVAGGQTAVANNADFAVFRYDPHGFLDDTFGRAGVASLDFQGREDRVHAVALQPDGKIVAVGQSEADFAVVRFNAA
ncbi:MAG TPA: delta-60 repeat domain-containing protein, partial [Acidimicrobiia bacterium]|nr:delta-60 repeat domain-containing protein [Acidimicrobiia bacterium]